MADIQEGQTATNPKTGQQIVYRGGQWHSAGAPAATPSAGPATTKQGMALKQRNDNLNALAAKFADVRDRYGRDLKGVGPGSILEYLPTPRNRAFDSSAAGLSDLAMASFRVPGVGAQSDADQRAFVKANEPHAADADEQIEAKLANIRNRIRAAGVAIPGEGDAAKRRAGFKVIR